jgi:hypothetical protein
MPLECVWTDYVGSTEDCWEVGDCYDGLWIEELEEVEPTRDRYTIIPDTEDAFYNESDFTINVSDNIILLVDQDLTTLDESEEWYVSIDLYIEDSVEVECPLVSVVQEGDLFVHTFVNSVAEQAGILTKIRIGGNSTLYSYVSGIGLADRDVVNFCTPLIFGYYFLPS